LSQAGTVPELVCGDCREWLAARAADSVDIIVTSPPYNLDLAYTEYEDSKDETAYLDWMVSVAAGLRRVLQPDGSFFLNISGTGTRPWLPFELIVRLRALFVLQNHIVWVKSVALAHDSVGHFKPVGGSRFLHHQHEHVFHLTLTGAVKLDRLAIGVTFKDKSNIARRGHAADLRCRGNTWFIPYETVQSKQGKFRHPGTFPIDLPRWCIRLCGKTAPVVLDPFVGTGTTVLAARREGASGIGIDIDPAYIAIARQRLECEPVL
jgi:site-specific DNA-methyltransferase (adenine-specific)